MIVGDETGKLSRCDRKLLNTHLEVVEIDGAFGEQQAAHAAFHILHVREHRLGGLDDLMAMDDPLTALARRIIVVDGQEGRHHRQHDQQADRGE
jgi:hypothetical protein